MPSEHDGRQRAQLCQDCWFWREMSCALPNPEGSSCANRRPLQGRAVAPIAELAPREDAPAPAQPMRVAAVVPFPETAPEANFSIVSVAERRAAVDRSPAMPSAREIRARAAAARVDDDGAAAAVRISVPEPSRNQPMLPGMEALVERVRRRTAERLRNGGHEV